MVRNERRLERRIERRIELRIELHRARRRRWSCFICFLQFGVCSLGVCVCVLNFWLMRNTHGTGSGGTDMFFYRSSQ